MTKKGCIIELMLVAIASRTTLRRSQITIWQALIDSWNHMCWPRKRFCPSYNRPLILQWQSRRTHRTILETWLHNTEILKLHHNETRILKWRWDQALTKTIHISPALRFNKTKHRFRVQWLHNPQLVPIDTNLSHLLPKSTWKKMIRGIPRKVTDFQ